MIRVRRRKNESASAMLYRFTKRIKRSGVLKEARKRRFKDRPVNKNKVRLSALHRERKKKEVERMKKLGLL